MWKNNRAARAARFWWNFFTQSTKCSNLRFERQLDPQQKIFYSLPPCENLRRKHHFRIELCLRLSILRLFHVGYVVEKCPFTWLTLMVSMQRQRTKDFLLQARVEALSSGPQIWQFLVVVLLITPKTNVLKCVLLVQHVSISLISGVFVGFPS